MQILKLVIVFAVMIGIIVLKQPLMVAAPIAAIICWILNSVPLQTGINAIIHDLTAWSTIQLIIMMYLITFMQSMLKARNGIDRSQKALTRLFHNNWITCTIAPFIIGLLPAAPAVFISGDVISEAVGDRLTNEQKATAASFFRHVSEAFMPTYAAILTALALTGFAAGEFVLGMLPMMIILVLIGCFFLYRGRVPVKAEGPKSSNKANDFKEFVLGIWPILAAIVLIVGFGMNVALTILLVTIAYVFTGRFKLEEIKPFFISSLQPKVIGNTLAVYVFKAILTSTDSISALPEFFSKLPIPTFLIFMLICFFGAIIAGSLTMTTTMIPVAFAAIPGSGLPLLCLLMCAVYAAMQISPTHVCLTLSCEHFGVSLGSLIKQTIPIIVTFLFVACLYYLGWTTLIG
ncbi:MAG: DUF401 family protein [Solobacterium sp.]|nr:DUF401 family protein [Solobacterium sp.]